MNYTLPDVRGADVKNKKVFLLADLDIPLNQFRIQNSEFRIRIGDETRLRVGLPTVQYLLNNQATVIVGGKLGRPSGKFQESLSLESVAKWYVQEFRIQNSEFRIQEITIEDFKGWKLNENFFLLENLRFYPGEEENDSAFAQKLAVLADIYVNDAFDLCHRKEASVVQVPYHLPHFAGLRLIEEVNSLQKIMDKPVRPFVVIIGGAKIETKLPLVKKILNIADFVLVGGKIAQEKSSLSPLQQGSKRPSRLLIADLTSSQEDISEESILEFTKVIQKAGTILWNGPMGKINSKLKVQSSKLDEDTEKGTREIVNAIIQSSAYKVAGGGDTVEFINKMGVFDKFDFISMAGGAMLTFVSGEPLPGLEALLE